MIRTTFLRSVAVRKTAEMTVPCPGRTGLPTTRRPFGPPTTSETSGAGPRPDGTEMTSPRDLEGTRIGTYCAESPKTGRMRVSRADVELVSEYGFAQQQRPREHEGGKR